MNDPSSGSTTSRHSKDEDEGKSTPSLAAPDAVAASNEKSGEAADFIIPSEKDQAALEGFKLLATMCSLTLVGFLMLLDVSIVSTAVPKITTQFSSLNDVGWYGSAYVLANSALQPLTGKIYTYFDRKWTFLAFFAIFEVGSLLCGVAVSSNMLIIGRAVAGMGSAGILNGAYVIIHASFPLQKQAFYLGVLVAISQLGMLSGPLIGGALTEYATWRWCFYINLPCGGAVAVLLVFVSLPSRVSEGQAKLSLRSKLGKLDLIGFAIFAPAAIELLLALQWGGTRHPWSSATIIGLFCGAFGTLLAFLAWEYRMGEAAMIPFSIIGKRAIWSSCLNYGCFMGSALASTYYLPIYFQAVRNATPVMSGVDILPTILTAMLFGIITGASIGRVGYYLPFAVASGAILTLGTGLVSTFTPTSTVGLWIGYQILQGVGRGLGIQVPIIAVQNNSAKKDVATVTAILVFAQNFGGAVVLSLTQVVFSSDLRSGLSKYAPEVNAEEVIVAGASGVRSAVSAASLPGVLLAYTKAFDRVMYLSTGIAGGAFLFAFGMGWVSVKQSQPVKPSAPASPASEQEEV